MTFLNNFIFISKELDHGAKFDGLLIVDLCTVQHFDPAVALTAGERHVDWEEVVGVPTTGEFHGSSLVVLVDDGVLPQELLSPGVVGVVSLALGYVGGPTPVWQRNGDGDIVELQVGVL